MRPYPLYTIKLQSGQEFEILPKENIPTFLEGDIVIVYGDVMMIEGQKILAEHITLK